MKDENESNGDSKLIIVEPNNKSEEVIIESVSFILKIKDVSHTITLCKGKNFILLYTITFNNKILIFQ